MFLQQSSNCDCKDTILSGGYARKKGEHHREQKMLSMVLSLITCKRKPVSVLLQNENQREITINNIIMNQQEQLSKHFTLWEMVRSGTAIKMNIMNEPGEDEVRALCALCENVLEPLRCRFGAITITSGYRCEKLNKAVGGVVNSQHTRGEAVDIFVPSVETGRKYFDFICNHTPFDQLIWEPRGSRNPRWLHVSYTTRRKNRGEVLY